MARATLHVCITCRREGADPEGPRPGRLLHDALTAVALPADLEIRAVECLSACTNGCSVALSAPGKWTYVYGRLDPAEHGAAILEGAARYAASGDGLVPWRERPEIFRKQCLARIPPLDSPVEPADV
jgi:predicted metal-binding protein